MSDLREAALQAQPGRVAGIRNGPGCPTSSSLHRRRGGDGGAASAARGLPQAQPFKGEAVEGEEGAEERSAGNPPGARRARRDDPQADRQVDRDLRRSAAEVMLETGEAEAVPEKLGLPKERDPWTRRGLCWSSTSSTRPW